MNEQKSNHGQFDKNPAYKCSVSVQAMRKDMGDAPVTAAEVVAYLLELHPEYAEGRAPNVRLTRDVNAAQQPLDDWLSDVSNLHEDKEQLLDGRLVILGLALTNRDLRRALQWDDFLLILMSENEPDYASLLTPEGRELYRKLFGTPYSEESYGEPKGFNSPATDDKPSGGEEADSKGISDILDSMVPAADEEEKPRVINTGFARRDPPQEELSPYQPLTAGGDYYYWFDEDIPHEKSMETTPVSKPDVPHGAALTIVLFEFDGELQVEDEADVGRMKVTEEGHLVVDSQPYNYSESLPKQEQRLYFPVRVPDEPGEYRMRCNMYWKQMLLQSRLITVNAVQPGAEFERETRQLRSDLDYTVSNTLDARILNKMETHRLSMMLNSNGDATHSVHIYGAADGRLVKESDVRFDEGELQNMIEGARRRMREASWKDLPGKKKRYLYEDGARNLKRLKKDLFEFARGGYKFWSKFIQTLDPSKAENFRELLVAPGLLQIAFKRSPRMLLPTAIFYDYPLKTRLNLDQYYLCDTFAQAFTDNVDLVNLLRTPCFQGECPQKDDDLVVCPGGFWGFRHRLGMPLSLCDLNEDEQLDSNNKCETPDMPAELAYEAPLVIKAGIATDLAQWAGHKSRLMSLARELEWDEGIDGNTVKRIFTDPPHLLYCYCHGGIDEDGAAYLLFGPDRSPALVGADDIERWELQWQRPRPLVFINGCHTTGVSPEQALELVTPLIRSAFAAGVIGTEVTIFEPLATRFAELCLGRFIAGDSIGEAIRLARLTLLMEGNPLGLVYIPFVQGGLRLVEQT